MISKKALLGLTLPLTFSVAFAKVQIIPKAELELSRLMRNESHYVLKNVKGTLLQKTIMESVTPENWFNLSPSDGAEGVRSEETYNTFGMPRSEDIIVAVVDSGVDVNHEDLQGKIWVNSDEIPNNGIDDDKNGYVDDVFGWNFIGGAKGMARMEKDETLKNGYRLVKGNPEAQVENDTLEMTRELVRMKKLKAQVEAQGSTLSSEETEYLNELKSTVEKKLNYANRAVKDYSSYLNSYKSSEAVLKKAGLSTITLDNVRNLQTTDASVTKAKMVMITLLSNGLTLEQITKVLDYFGEQAKYSFNENFNPRTIVGDNYEDPTERFYGNNDVTGPDSSHGTHVSGIIGAVRDNGIGIKGVATNVKIMAVRVVPNGDERDKDVANGIRYAVDNGARIINMSFGKAQSPYKKVVDEAVKYAESKGVLLVHAAGNDNSDNDVVPDFPNRREKTTGKEFTNWLEIGASSFLKGPTLPADFSNFGKNTVDFFAPGVDILSTTPNNTYDTYSGTSMATPATVGVAALILSYSPALKVEELKSLMINKSREYPGLEVNKPGTEELVPFSSLSITGTVVDVFEAVKGL